MTRKQIEKILYPSIIGTKGGLTALNKAIDKIMALHETAINKVRDKAKTNEEINDSRTYEDIMGVPLCPFRGNACSNTTIDGNKGPCGRCRVSEMYGD